jgi:flagellin
MAMTINTNYSSLDAQRQLSKTQSALSTAMQRLSSGLRVNSAKDDAAGLAISVKMQAQVNGGTVAIRNANDGISLAQTAEGALSSVTDMLQRQRELAVQSSNATNSSDRTELKQEFDDLSAEINRVVKVTEFNGVKVLADANIETTGLDFQIGANNTANDRINIKITNLSADTTLDAVTGVAGGTAADISTATGAQGALDSIDTAITTINTVRSTLGSAQNRFDYTVSNLEVSNENTSAAKGRITDADFATETSNMSKASILQQAGTSMLAQANSQAQQVLTLLK